MKKIVVALLLFIYSYNVQSQGINNLWLMGRSSWAGPSFGGVNMDFTGGVLSISHQIRPMNFNETNGVICDKNGNLLFYSNGIYIANAQNDTMMNGVGLNPGPWTSTRDSFGLTLPQGNLIIPFPTDTTKYYLFHGTVDDYGNTYGSFYLYYSVIDMTLDGGLGAVVKKNVVLLNDTLVTGLLTACKHGNGRDWWMTCHEFGTNKYYKYLITDTGIAGPFFQNIGSVRDIWSQCVFSPDGNWFAYYCPLSGDLDVYEFDRCTGTFSNPINIIFNDSAVAGGVAFSAQSSVLYVSSMNYVYQFDMMAANIATSQTTVAVWDSFYSPSPPFATNFYLSHLAPDGKIYINCGNGTFDMHVINFPDSLGVACDLQQHSIHLPAKNAFTMVNHPNYFLNALAGSICDTLTAVTNIKTGIGDVNVFPNPANRLLYVQWRGVNNLRKAELHVYNTMGQLMSLPFTVLKEEYFELNVSQLPTGIYFIELLTEQGKVVKRFVKQ